MDHLSDFASILLFSFSIIILIWLKSKLCKGKSNKLPPCIPGILPIIGYPLTIIKLNYDFWATMKKLFDNILQDERRIFTLKFAYHNFYVLSHPDDCYEFANKCFDKHSVYSTAKGFLGEGLLTADALKWKTHRKLINPFMNQQVLNTFISIFNEKSKQLVNVLKEKAHQGPLDHLPYIRSITINIVCATIMGYENNEKIEQLQVEYIVYLKLIFKLFMYRFKRIWTNNDTLFKWSGLKKQQDELVTHLNKLSDLIIAETRSEMKLNTHAKMRCRTFLELVLKLKSENLLTAEEVKDEINTMIAAAYDTTWISTGQIIVVLGSYPDVQEKIYIELQNIFDGSDRDVTKEDLSNMKYLDAVIKETLRLYPTVPFIIREIGETINLREYTLPAGDGIILPLYVLNRHPIWGPDANEFRPERWLDPSCIPERAHASFSIGRRNCIGMTYAMMNMKTILVQVLRRCKIKADVSNVNYEFNITLNPTSGHYISIEER